MKNLILPDDVIALVESEGEGLMFGSVMLEIFFRDGHPRWKVTRSKSIQKGIDANCSETGDAA